jgi:RimJ/RimL family protein N-acetyltransferase
MIKVETERLIVREFTHLDIDNLYSLLSDPIVMKYCSGPLNMKETQKWLETIKRYYNKYGYNYWAAIDKTTGEFIGQLGIIQQEVDDEWIDCIAFMICKDKWGKGYATEGGKGCITYGFQILKRKKLYATVEPGNTASKSVLKKIGMRYEREAVCFDTIVHLYSIEVT